MAMYGLIKLPLVSSFFLMIDVLFFSLIESVIWHNHFRISLITNIMEIEKENLKQVSFSFRCHDKFKDVLLLFEGLIFSRMF